MRTKLLILLLHIEFSIVIELFLYAKFKLYNTNEYSISEIILIAGISQATLYRYIRKQNKFT